MNSRKKSAFHAKLFCFFRVVLVVLFGIQACLLYLVRRDVELPVRVCEWIAEKAAPAGTRVEIGGGSLRRLAFLELRKISLSREDGPAPIVSARSAGVYFNWKNILRPNKNVQTFFLDGFELCCPASLSQSGKPEVVLSEGSVNVAYSFGEIYLKNAVARIGDVSVQASGAFNPARFGRREDGDAVGENSTAGILAPIYKVAETLSSINRKIDEFTVRKNTFLRVTLEPTDSDEIVAHAKLFCESLKMQNPDISVKELCIRGSVVWDSEIQTALREIPVRASARSLEYSLNAGELFDAWNFSAEEIDFASLLSVSQDFEISPENVAVSAAKVTAGNFLQGTFSIAPVIAEADKSLTFVLNTQAFGSAIAAGIDFSRSRGTRIVLDTELDFPQLKKIPQVSGVLPEEVRKLELGEKLNVRAEVRLDPEFDFIHADYVLESGAMVLKTLRADTVYSRGKFTKDELDISLARICGERYCANARLFFELKPNGKYRVQAFGSTVNPEALDDYLGWFWWRIWKNLSVPDAGTAPRADVDVYGSFSPEDHWQYVYGAIAGENITGGGVLVDKVSLRVAEEPTFISAFDMNFRRGNDRVAGTLQWHYALEPEYHFRDFRFGFAGSMPPADVFNIVGEGLPEIFDGILVCEQAGTAVVRGFVSGDEYFYPQERILVEADVTSAPGAFCFAGVEGTDFVGKINYDSGNVRVAPFSAGCGKGNISGEILVRFPPDGEDGRLALNLNVSNMPVSTLSEAVENLAAFGKAPAESPVSTEEKPKEEDAEDLSRLTASFRGEMTLPDIDSLTASGTFSLEDPTLFNLRVFGSFSRFLEMLKISLTSFAFTNAESDFSVEGGKIYLPNLKVYGESGELSIRLNTDIDTRELNGDAVFKNRRFTQIPVFGKFVDWASETTTLIPIELSGTLDEIKWKAKPFDGFKSQKINHGEAPSSRRDNDKNK